MCSDLVSWLASERGKHFPSVQTCLSLSHKEHSNILCTYTQICWNVRCIVFIFLYPMSPCHWKSLWHWLAAVLSSVLLQQVLDSLLLDPSQGFQWRKSGIRFGRLIPTQGCLVYWSAWASLTKYIHSKIYFSQFWKTEVQDQYQQIHYWWESSSSLACILRWQRERRFWHPFLFF